MKKNCVVICNFCSDRSDRIILFRRSTVVDDEGIVIVGNAPLIVFRERFNSNKVDGRTRFESGPSTREFEKSAVEIGADSLESRAAMAFGLEREKSQFEAFNTAAGRERERGEKKKKRVGIHE